MHRIHSWEAMNYVDGILSWFSFSRTVPRYRDITMSAMVSQITNLTIVYSVVYYGVDKKKPYLHITGLCEGNPPATGEFPAQRAGGAENVSIWWRHHDEHWLHLKYIAKWTHFFFFAQHVLKTLAQLNTSSPLSVSAHWNLSFWLPVQPVIKISSTWRHFQILRNV